MVETNPLSPREAEILELVAKGLTNREIAQKLSISPNTVKVHLSNIFEKANVSSRTEATLYGMTHGLVDVPEGATDAVPSEQPQPTIFQRSPWAWVVLGALLVAFLILLSTKYILSLTEIEQSSSNDLRQRWQELDPLPEPLRGMATVTYDGNIYTFAGESPQGVSKVVYRYNFDEEVWDRRRDKPTAVTDVQAVFLGEKIYIPGGMLSDGSPTDVLEIYDPRTNRWEKGATLPVAVSAYALVNFEGQMILFGGWDGNGEGKHLLIYNPMADSWRIGSPLPIPRANARAVALEDMVILMGGKNEGEVLASTNSYFPARDVDGGTPWEDFIDLPLPLYNFGVMSVFDKIYVVGGKTAIKSGGQNTGWLMADEEWVQFPTQAEHMGHETVMTSLGSLLAVLDTNDTLSITRVWTYQAFYYSIYIPFAP